MGEFADETTRSDQPDDDALADARRWGFDEDAIMSVESALKQDQGKKLWHMHVTAFSALCAGATQWRTRLVATESGFVDRVAGLDYAGLKVAFDAIGLCLDARDWGRLMVLERAAASALNGGV